MKPLDLRAAAPRPTRERLLGFFLLARTIDKLRAELPGGHMGEYLNHETGFSAYLVRRLGLVMNELRETVARAQDEAEVLKWLRARVDERTAESVNAKLETFVAEKMSTDDQVLLRQRHPIMAGRPELSNILDILDAEDERAFAE